MESKLSLLRLEQVDGNNKLEIFNKTVRAAAITDFAVILGGHISGEGYAHDSGIFAENVPCYTVDGSNKLNKRTGMYWLEGNVEYKQNFRSYIPFVSDNSRMSVSGCNADDRTKGIRLSLENIKINELINNTITKDENENIIIEYGFYPRNIVSETIKNKLKHLYEHNQLKESGNIYTSDSMNYNDATTDFTPIEHKEYELEGKRYIRVKINVYFESNYFKLSDGKIYRNGDIVWLEVEPIKWLIDEGNKVMITEEIIVAGLQFENTFKHIKEKLINRDKSDIENIKFEDTNIKRFIDKYLSKELFQIKEKDIEKETENNKNEKLIEQFSVLISKLKTSGYTDNEIQDLTNNLLTKKNDSIKKKELKP